MESVGTEVHARALGGLDRFTEGEFSLAAEFQQITRDEMRDLKQTALEDGARGFAIMSPLDHAGKVLWFERPAGAGAEAAARAAAGAQPAAQGGRRHRPAGEPAARAGASG